MFNRAVFRTGLLSVGVWCSLQPLAIASSQSLVDEVVDHLTGVLDTTEQARRHPEQPAVQMTTCRIDVAVDDSMTGSATFLYQEQALAASLAQPYRQRLLQIAPLPGLISGGFVESISYRPLETEALVGLCDRPLAERSLSFSQIGEVTCRVFLTPVPEGFRGVTASEGCPTDVRGAVRVTNEILLHNRGMDTWDRGFDAAGQQVWGATTDPYQFRRQNSDSDEEL